MTSLGAIIAMLLSAAVANHTWVRANEVPPNRSTTLSASFSPFCLKDTGILIPRNGHPCSATGHTYTDGDIKRTGASSVGDALRLLDPSITIHR
jgi:hypothetical protein